MHATLLEPLLESLTECLTTDSAQKIADLRADDALQRRVDELADKANAGVLTQDERAEYDRYLAAFHLVTQMQSRARRLLR